MDSELLKSLLGLAVILVIGGIAVWSIIQGKKYMKKQKEEGTDRKRLMDALAVVLEDKIGDFTYAVGKYTKSERRGNTTHYWYYSYVLAFNENDVLIIPFVVKEGKVLFRNLMPINWEETQLKYRPGKKDIRIDFSIAGAAITMFVPYVMKSSGVENSSEPLGFYQENEVERLLSCLPKYPAKK